MKRNLIVKLGDLLYSDEKLNSLKIGNRQVDLSGSDYFKILAYAPMNFNRDFEDSDLGHLMAEVLKEDSVFVDIGANLGGYSILSMKLGAETHLFEPVDELYKVLNNNPEYFGIAYPYALSDSEEEISFNISSSNIGGSSLVASSDSENSGYDGIQKVQTKSFDAVFEKEIGQNKKFHLVKVDVEGNELKTVKGMRAALERNLIDHLWCEVRGLTSDRNPGSFKRVSDYLKQFNYSAFTYKNGLKEPFEYEREEDLPQFFDLLFCKHE